MCITQAGVWLSCNLQFLFFCLKHEVSVMKKWNNIGKCKWVYTCSRCNNIGKECMARNVAQWNSAKLWILYDVENKKTKGTPLIILQWTKEWVYFIIKKPILTVAANEGEKTV